MLFRRLKEPAYYVVAAKKRLFNLLITRLYDDNPTICSDDLRIRDWGSTTAATQDTGKRLSVVGTLFHASRCSKYPAAKNLRHASTQAQSGQECSAYSRGFPSGALVTTPLCKWNQPANLKRKDLVHDHC